MLNKLVAVILATMALLVIGAFRTREGGACVGPTPTPTPSVFSKGEAMGKALERARFCGMEGVPAGVKVRYMTLTEYAQLLGEDGPQSDKPVWVVSLRTTDFNWTCPNPPPCPVEFLVVVIDIQSWRILDQLPSCRADDSPFPVP